MQRRHVRFANMSEAIADAQNLAKGYEQTGGWNLEQNLSHLNKSLRMATQGLDWGMPKLIRPIMRWMFVGRMERLGSGAIKVKASAPPELQPDEDLNLQAQLDEFERLSIMIELPETVMIDSHPVFGKCSRSQWQTMQCWHAAHHLSFLVPIS